MSRYAASHADPHGPGDARPTALQIVEDEGLVNKLAGKVALITGANQGIGLETARALHATGAAVFLTARNLTKAQKAIDDILTGPGPNSDAPLHPIELSLDSLDSVRSAAKSFLAQSNKLNILILNAGVMATPQGKTTDGFETQFGTNHVGHFLLFQLLKPALLAATSPQFQSRVVSVSSMGHRASGIRFHDFNFEKDPYDPWAAYGQSKTANIYLANEVERRYGSRGLHALSVHPGVIMTNLGQYLSEEYKKGFVGNDDLRRTLRSVTQGAATTVYAAVSKEWEGRGGKFLNSCAEEIPAKPDANWTSPDPGYASWVYDEPSATKLWEESCKLVGVEDDGSG